MKRVLKYMILGCLAVSGLWSCNDAKSPALENSIYLPEAADRDEYDCLIKPMRDSEFDIIVKMTHKVDHDVRVTMAVDHDLLERHYEEFGENLSILPTDNWIIYDTDGTPKAGDRIELTFPANQTVATFPLRIITVKDAEESQYALPISIESVSEDIHVLSRLKSALYLFQAPFETTAMFFTDKKMHLQALLPDFPTLRQWTLEFHFHIQRGQSQPLYGCPLVSLGPSEIYVRQYFAGGGMDIHILGTFGPGSYNVGNKGYPGDYYQNTAYQGQWSHFALVCQNGTITSYLNGKEMTVTSSAQFDTEFTENRLNIADGNAEALVAYSELRFWSVARTPAQIQRFKYTVEPDTKGLEIYYPLNEETDTVIKDLSYHGYDIDITESSSKINWGRVKTNDDFTSFVTVQ